MRVDEKAEFSRSVWVEKFSPIEECRPFTFLEAWFFLVSESDQNGEIKNFNRVKMAVKWGWSRRKMDQFLSMMNLAKKCALSDQQTDHQTDHQTDQQNEQTLKINDSGLFEPQLQSSLINKAINKPISTSRMRTHDHAPVRKIVSTRRDSNIASSDTRDHDPRRDSSVSIAGESMIILGYDHTEDVKTDSADRYILDSGFAAFWTLYPKKKEKAACLAYWKANKLAGLQKEIMEGLKRHLSSVEWAKDNGEFIVWPIRFLKNRRWEDETTPLSEQKPKDPYVNGRLPIPKDYGPSGTRKL